MSDNEKEEFNDAKFRDIKVYDYDLCGDSCPSINV